MKYENIVITKRTPIIIYGAAEAGKSYLEVLQKNGYEVIAFLDRRAKNIKSEMGIPVLPPNTNEISDFNKSNGLVIITVLNVYVHDEIADYLNKQGYENILFKHNICGKKNCATKVLNEIFDGFFLRQDFLNVTLPKYVSLGTIEIDNAIIEKNEEYVIAYFPAEALFSGGKYYYENHITSEDLPKELRNNLDKSILFFVKPKMLFLAMDGELIDEEWKDYLEYYLNTRKFEGKTDKIDTIEWRRHFEERYRIYQIMSNNLMVNNSYFQENPLSIVYTKDKRLTILDGMNRTGFLLAKRIYKIPCRIKKDDWKIYYNEEKVKKIKQYLQQSEVNLLFYPLSHSAFVSFVAEEEILAQETVIAINQYLLRNSFQLDNLNILDVGSKNGYFAQFYAKAGASITGIEASSSQRELFALINNLLNVEGKINITDCISQLAIDTFDIVILHHHFSDNNNLLDLKLRNFNGIIFKEVLYEINDRSENNGKRLIHAAKGCEIFDLLVFGGVN